MNSVQRELPLGPAKRKRPPVPEHDEEAGEPAAYVAARAGMVERMTAWAARLKLIKHPEDRLL